MKLRRTLFVGTLAALLLFVAFSGPVQADVIGSTYSFSAVWYEHSYQVDGVVVEQTLRQGTFQIEVYNITPGDAYEFTFTGMNSQHLGDLPYQDEFNDTSGFDDNTIYFDLSTVDDDSDDLAELTDLDFHISPSYHSHDPGAIIFVDPVWVTHNTDWDAAVTDAESQDGFESITETADEGSFSVQIVVNVEYEHDDYGNMTGTTTLAFTASYDADGVLNTWDFTRTTSLSTDEHSVTTIDSSRFTRGSGSGGGFIGSTELMTTLTIAGISVVGGLVLGVLIAKRYWG